MPFSVKIYTLVNCHTTLDQHVFIKTHAQLWAMIPEGPAIYELALASQGLSLVNSIVGQLLPTLRQPDISLIVTLVNNVFINLK